MNRYTRIKDFHGSRAKGVGSSDIPTLVGLNKRYDQTPLTLWREKTGRAPGFDGNERTEWGNYLEPLILRKFVSDRWGAEVGQDFYRNATRAEPVSTGELKVKTECFHPRYPFALAHADLVVDGPAAGATPFIVEAKSTGFMAGKRREGQTSFDGYAEDDDSQHGIPDKVFLQTQWQEFVYDIPEAFVAVLIDTAQYKLYGPIVADAKTQEKCLALAERFWWHVEHDKEPQPTTWDDVVSLSPVLSDTTASIGGDAELEVRAMINEGEKLKARAAEIEERLEDIKDALGILGGNNRILTNVAGDVLAKFYDKSRETLSSPGHALDDKAPGFLTFCEKLKKKAALPSGVLSAEEKELLDIEARLRALDLVKVSRWREVRY